MRFAGQFQTTRSERGGIEPPDSGRGRRRFPGRSDGSVTCRHRGALRRDASLGEAHFRKRIACGSLQLSHRQQRRCGISYQRATVELETSYGEVLDVIRAEVLDSTPNAGGCLAAYL